MAHKTALSRRSFLAGGLALAGGVGGVFLLDRGARHFRSGVLHRPGPPLAEPPSAQTLATLTAYLGAYFGRILSKQDIAELSDRLTFAATRDSGWAAEYATAAALLDDAAADRGARAYISADQATQVAIIENLREPVRGPLANLRLGASDAVLARERMRVSTSRHLVRLYRRSGVPWRKRGFATWPGTPDQMPAYLRLKNG